VHQHDIDFDVVAQDTRGPGFIGNVWLGKNSLAAMLLEEGFAKTFRSTDREYEVAESIAKKKRRGIWKDYDEAAELAAQQARKEEFKDTKKPKQELIDVIVTEIVNATTFYVQVVGPEAEQLEELMKKLATDDTPGEYKPLQMNLLKLSSLQTMLGTEQRWKKFWTITSIKSVMLTMEIQKLFLVQE